MGVVEDEDRALPRRQALDQLAQAGVATDRRSCLVGRTQREEPGTAPVAVRAAVDGDADQPGVEGVGVAQTLMARLPGEISVLHHVLCLVRTNQWRADGQKAAANHGEARVEIRRLGACVTRLRLVQLDRLHAALPIMDAEPRSNGTSPGRAGIGPVRVQRRSLSVLGGDTTTEGTGAAA